VSIKPDYAEAHCNRGSVLLAMQRVGEALSSYDKAIAIKPDYAAAYVNRAMALLLAGTTRRGGRTTSGAGRIPPAGSSRRKGILHNRCGWDRRRWPVNPFFCRANRVAAIPSNFAGMPSSSRISVPG
jgi:tetratricopeptide (TPR) repeat protein